MRWIELLSWLTLSMACAPLATACRSGAAARPAAPVLEEDLRMGRLGHWLGTYLTIGGVRDTHGKSGSSLLQVDTVNGAPLDPPVSIRIEDVALNAGERVELAGYESGRFIGMPEGVADATGLPLTQAMWQFYRYFIATSIESGGTRM